MKKIRILLSAFVIILALLLSTPRRMMLERGAHSNWAKKRGNLPQKRSRFLLSDA